MLKYTKIADYKLVILVIFNDFFYSPSIFFTLFCITLYSKVFFISFYKGHYRFL